MALFGKNKKDSFKGKALASEEGEDGQKSAACRAR